MATFSSDEDLFRHALALHPRSIRAATTAYISLRTREMSTRSEMIYQEGKQVREVIFAMSRDAVARELTREDLVFTKTEDLPSAFIALPEDILLRRCVSRPGFAWKDAADGKLAQHPELSMYQACLEAILDYVSTPDPDTQRFASSVLDLPDALAPLRPFQSSPTYWDPLRGYKSNTFWAALANAYDNLPQWRVEGDEDPYVAVSRILTARRHAFEALRPSREQRKLEEQNQEHLKFFRTATGGNNMRSIRLSLFPLLLRERQEQSAARRRGDHSGLPGDFLLPGTEGISRKPPAPFRLWHSMGIVQARERSLAACAVLGLERAGEWLEAFAATPDRSSTATFLRALNQRDDYPEDFPMEWRLSMAKASVEVGQGDCRWR